MNYGKTDEPTQTCWACWVAECCALEHQVNYRAYLPPIVSLIVEQRLGLWYFRDLNNAMKYHGVGFLLLRSDLAPVTSLPRSVPTPSSLDQPPKYPHSLPRRYLP